MHYGIREHPLVQEYFKDFACLVLTVTDYIKVDRSFQTSTGSIDIRFTNYGQDITCLDVPGS